MPGILSGAAVASRLAAPISPALCPARLAVNRLQALSRTRTRDRPRGRLAPRPAIPYTDAGVHIRLHDTARRIL